MFIYGQYQCVFPEKCQENQESNRKAFSEYVKPFFKSRSNIVEMNRVWEMPNKWTFQVKAIKKLVYRYLGDNWIDPFAGLYSPASITNDIEKDRNTTFHMDGLEFLKSREDRSADGVLFDPPYSVEQCLRSYTPKFQGTAGRTEYQRKCKDEISRIIKSGGIVISFGWNSCGIGKTRGFKIIEILLVCHGGYHYDTIVTVERKLGSVKSDEFFE